MTMKLQTAGGKLTWSFDWTTNYLDQTTSPVETIDSRQWSINPDASPTHLSNATSATVTVDNLVFGNTYILTEFIVTSAGVEEEQSLTIVCGQR